jgi:hypothetical protein
MKPVSELQPMFEAAGSIGASRYHRLRLRRHRLTTLMLAAQTGGCRDVAVMTARGPEWGVRDDTVVVKD